MTCDACAATVPDGARWCGRCGAPTGPPPVPAVADDVPPTLTRGVVRVDAAAAEPAASPSGRRVPARWLAAVLAAGVVLTGVLVSGSPPAPVSLLGRLDLDAGASAVTGPGPLETVRFRVRVAERPGVAPDVAPLARAAGDEHLVLRSGLVVARDGTVVRSGTPAQDTGPGVGMPVADDGVTAVADDGALVLLDAVAGSVQGRRAAGFEAADPIDTVLGTADGGLLVTAGPASGLLERDGSTRWVLPADVEPIAGATSDRWLPTLRRGGILRLVDARTGEVRPAFLPSAPTATPVVVPLDDEAATAVAVVGGAEELVAYDVPGGTVRWRQDLPDIDVVVVPTEEAVVALLLAGGAPVGTTSVETALVLFDPATGDPRAVLPGPLGDDAAPPRPGTWAADDEGIVTVRFGRLDVTSWDRRATVESVDLADVREVALVGDRVVARHGTGDAERVSLIDRTAREVLASWPVRRRTGAALVAHVDGHVLVGRPGAPLEDQSLVRVVDGAVVPPGDVAPELATPDVRVLGLRPDGSPVVATALRDDLVTLLDPDGTTRDLRVPPTGAVAATLPRPIGLVGDRLALVTRSGLGERTLLLDPSGAEDGVVREDVVALGVADGRLLGLDESGVLVPIDPRTGAPDVPAEDALAGPGARAVGLDAVVAGPDGLAVGRTDGATQLVAVDPGTARVVWRTLLPSPALTRPVVVGGLVVHVAADGAVVAHRAADGGLAWTHVPEAGGPATALTGAGDAVVVGTLEGTLLVLDDDGVRVDALDLGTAAIEAVAVVGTDVVALADGVLVGAGAADGTVPAEDLVDLP